MQNVHFSTNELAELFRVNVSTVKRWIDRDLLVAEITPGGHRRVTKKQLEIFIRNNKKLSLHSYVLKRLNKKTENRKDAWKHLYKKLLANDIAACRNFLRDYFLSQSKFTFLLEDIMTPVLRHIGEEWANKRISIYQEHQMSFLIRLFLVEMNSYIPEPSKNAPKAVLACVEGDRHEIPLQMLSLILKMRGVAPIVLGTNIPVSEIIRACENTKPSFLLITRVFQNLRTFNYLQTLARYADIHKIRMIYGGEGWSEKEKRGVLHATATYKSSLASFDTYIQSVAL